MKIGTLTEQPTPAGAVYTAPAANGSVDASSVRAIAATADASAGIAASHAARAKRSDATTAYFDAAGVAPISKAIGIGTGSFTINPEAIADKLIANAQELLARVRC